MALNEETHPPTSIYIQKTHPEEGRGSRTHTFKVLQKDIRAGAEECMLLVTKTLLPTVLVVQMNI